MAKAESLPFLPLKKYSKKVTRCLHILRKDCNVEASGDSSNYEVLYLGNLGHTTGYDDLLVLQCLTSCNADHGVVNISIIPGKQYCFVTYSSSSQAQTALSKIVTLSTNDPSCGKENCLQGSLHYKDGCIYAALISTVPEYPDTTQYHWPEGLSIIEDFISAEEETAILNSISWDDDDLHSSQLGSSLKHRQVRHYGYEFQYGSNSIDRKAPLLQAPIPPLLASLTQRMLDTNVLQQRPDQVTVNRYQPGQGIAAHTDSHNACGDVLVSLSTGSPVLMDFTLTKQLERAGCTQNTTTQHAGASLHCGVLLKPRALCVMTAHARYAWRHGIKTRATDIVPSPPTVGREGGGVMSLLKRGLRTSFTFRTTRDDVPCDCPFPLYCPSRQASAGDASALPTLENSGPAELEARHVHAVYDNIASHFSDTRHKPWPNVNKFVSSLSPASTLLDVGCGNGKYLSINSGIWQVGCDSSGALLNICRDRAYQAVQCNCLSLPYRDASFDAVICIAVLHHLASEDRRYAGIQEICRVLRCGGQALVYVWALEQRKSGRNSSYLKQNKKNRTPSDVSETLQSPDQSRNISTDEYAVKVSSDDSNQVSGNIPQRENSSTTEETLEKCISNIKLDDTRQPRMLRIHENRTNFVQQDMLVPWKLKPSKNQNGNSTNHSPVFHRFYHTFKEGELENICSSIDGISIVKSYYDEGNWCIIIEKNK